MASTTQCRRLGWLCAPELLVALTIATTMLRGCSGGIPVPVVVSTVYRPVPSVYDVTTDGAGALLLKWSSGAVYRGFPNGTTAQLVSTIPDSGEYYGITCDVSANVAYITGYLTYRVYKLVLSAKSVSIFAGSGVQGTVDGAGTAARFYGPLGITHYAPTGLLYVADRGSGAIRKIVVATANVTTVATVAACYNLCVTANGVFLYVTTENIIVRVNTTQINSVTTLAGSTSGGYLDGVGAAAQFNGPAGIALNSDESALIIADFRNYRIRRLELSTNSVTTIAGSSAQGAVDGPGLSATFSYPSGATWHCNRSSMLCGVLLADGVNGAVRFAAVEGRTATVTASLSALSSGTASKSWSHSGTESPSTSYCDTGSESKPSKSTQLSGTVSPTGAWTGTLATATRPASTSLTIKRSALSTRSAYRTIGTVSWSRSSTQPMTNSVSSPSCSHSRTALCVSPTSPSLSITRQRSGTQRSVSSSPTMYCSLVPGGASGEQASLHRVNVLPAGATAVVPAGAEVVDDSSVTIDEAVTEPVSRQSLFEGCALAANMSLTLGGALRGVDDAADGWAVVGALLDVVTADAAFPVLSAPAEVTFVSSRVVGREQLLVCLLRPPNGTGSPRWLPSTLSVFRDVTLRLRLRLRCPADVAATQDVVIAVPSPGQAVVLEAEVKAAGVASQYASWVGAPAAGSAVGRLSAVRGLVACDGSGAVGGLLPLPVAADCDQDASASSDAEDARGAVLGNAVLWAAGCALMALLTCGYSRCAGVPLRTAAEALGVPSPLLPLVVATVPSTVSSTFVLLRSSCAADRGVAAVGVVMTVVPIAVLCGLSLLVPHLLHLEAHEAHWTSGAVAAALRAVVGRLLHRRVRWGCRSFLQDPDAAARPLRLERVVTVVLLEYAVVWYLCVDVAVLTAAGLLGAVSTLGSLAACRGSAVAVAVLYVGQLVLCAAVRPYTTLLSHVHTVFCLALSAVSVWCQVWYLFASARDGADLDALGALLAVSAVCDIVVSAASMLRALMDVVEALRAYCRNLDMLMARVDGSGAFSEDVVLSAVCTNMMLMDGEARSDDAVDGGASVCLGAAVALTEISTAFEDLQEQRHDAQFWQSDGSAVAGGAVGVAGVGNVWEDMHRDAAHDLLHFSDPVLLG